MHWNSSSAPGIDTFPTPIALPRLSRSRAEALGLELFLPNGITRAGWLTIPGNHLGPDTTAEPERVGWSWDLWPWPRVFVARLACTWERNHWRDVHGLESEWCMHPPAVRTTAATGNGDVPPRPWRVERHQGDTMQVVAQMVPQTLTSAIWTWHATPPDDGPPWGSIWSFRAVGV